MTQHGDDGPGPLGEPVRDPLQFLTGGTDDPRVQGAAQLQRRGWGAAGVLFLVIIISAIAWSIVGPTNPGPVEPTTTMEPSPSH